MTTFQNITLRATFQLKHKGIIIGELCYNRLIKNPWAFFFDDNVKETDKLVSDIGLSYPFSISKDLHSFFTPWLKESDTPAEQQLQTCNATCAERDGFELVYVKD